MRQMKEIPLQQDKLRGLFVLWSGLFSASGIWLPRPDLLQMALGRAAVKEFNVEFETV